MIERVPEYGGLLAAHEAEARRKEKGVYEVRGKAVKEVDKPKESNGIVREALEGIGGLLFMILVIALIIIVALGAVWVAGWIVGMVMDLAIDGFMTARELVN